MSHSILHGVRRNVSHGDRHGGSDTLASMVGVTRDATSLIYTPATAAEWTQTMQAAGIASAGPSLLWLLQEASGNVTDTIGGFTGTASGTLTYQQAVAGWTRTGIKGSEGVAGILQTSAAGLPDLSTNSMLALAYISFPALPAATRSVVTLGSIFNSRTAFESTTTGAVIDQGNQFTAMTSPANGIHPIVVRLNRTATTWVGTTDVDKKASATGAAPPAGKAFVLHGDNTQTNFASAATIMYATAWFNSAAELTDAQVKSLLQTLGWTITWT